MNFSNLNLTTQILSQLPAKLSVATEIQKLAIPEILAGKDVLALAQTGSGKTYAFALPLLQTISNSDMSDGEIKALVIVPTRELALQIAEAIELVSATVKVTVLCGGVDRAEQVKGLGERPQLVVATPGRLLDFLRQQQLSLHGVKQLVLDEADRLMDMGFWPDLESIVEFIPAERQTLLFSATLMPALNDKVAQLLSNPIKLTAQAANSVATNINESVYLVNKGDKAKALSALLKQHQWSQVLVFINGRDDADKLAKRLVKAGIHAAALHGDKEHQQRQQTLEAFKGDELQVLVTTDLLSRGIHIDALPVVINFALPMSAPVYVHRIGRTARAGDNGRAISLVCHGELDNLKAIEKLTGRGIKLEPLDGFEVTDKPASAVSKRPPRDKKANRRSQNKRSVKDFVSKR
ncbi:DEAD/DEAH box helicase [Shewanella fidelis]|uniref:DEAD/DEAH box helicase n=1 Tax=Shewanella fidelis TaxID=173509 RepID=A0AAW8NNZ8_9GAMM|nr:DEAD/DEAH box helicase [Shewanella fidelis]MDR8524923.1 DEAD/DEAH box helicase [Shewanella fidelis]MDW4810994.1 DEAD/DEAH box helicase [Shewanella fidelis]MDW4815227.1 DEAD/DEAH box helicase [Shewanella fidelis]MDW4819317.1 DEAD/DEAH box helicase [Shewanella fidelis]MDW4823005.1 DEAD/DEAH box helicase [Shewanella fidelis]